MPHSLLRTHAHHLQAMLQDDTLDHDTRAQIGEQLDGIGDARPGVGVRSDGIPDIAWCYVDVPAEQRGIPIPFQNERGKVYGEFILEPFFIAKYLVTYQQFEAFREASDGFVSDKWWTGLTEEYHRQNVLDQRTPLHNHPRDTISWYQAVAFARWVNTQCQGEILAAPANASSRSIIGENVEIRLPLEWEWQWAAQGSDGRRYPWGNWDERFANTRACRLCRTTAVGMYPQGASWCGAMDMSGTLWEWCLNEYKDASRTAYGGHQTRVLRGGSFVDVPDYAVCALRFNDLPNRRLDYFGFRVVCAQPSVHLNRVGN